MKNVLIFIAAFLLSDGCYAQLTSEIKMSNKYYMHSSSPSFESNMIQAVMGMMGVKKNLEKKMLTNGFVLEPEAPTKSLLRNFNVVEGEQNGRKIWTISPISNKSNVVILYLHGGAYMANITKQHWDVIDQLVRELNATIVVPDYPLAPDASCSETFNFIDVLYSKLICDYRTKRIIILGDSAGGGLAFGFLQQLKTENKMQPEQIIIFSPWLDVTMNNPDIELIAKNDKILSIMGLRSAGRKYAGDFNLNDYRVSPIYGDFSGLCQISIFTGTNDLLNADARKCNLLMNAQQVRFNYFEYPNMFHDWVLILSLKESQHVISQVGRLVNK